MAYANVFRLDLDSRLSLGFAFGIFGLSVELVGWLCGFQISSVLTGAFVTIILATFGAQIVRGVRAEREDLEASRIEAEESHRREHGYIP